MKKPLYRFNLECGLCFSVPGADPDEAIENAKELLHTYSEGVSMEMFFGDKDTSAMFFPDEDIIDALSEDDIEEDEDEDDYEDDEYDNYEDEEEG